MAMINFDASEVEPSSFEAVPAGTYEAVITDSLSKSMKSGNGIGFNFTFEIVSGECRGRKIFEWITFEHRTSQDAQRIGREQLSAICRAVGVVQLTDTTQLHNIPLLITVAVDRNDSTRNVIKAVKAKDAPKPAAASAANPAQAPWARS